MNAEVANHTNKISFKWRYFVIKVFMLRLRKKKNTVWAWFHVWLYTSLMNDWLNQTFCYNQYPVICVLTSLFNDQTIEQAEKECFLHMG